MKRFIRDYANDIQKELDRELALIHDPKKLTVYSLKDVEARSSRLKDLMAYAERDLLTPTDAMRALCDIDPRR